jgi:hypothetical protein
VVGSERDRAGSAPARVVTQRGMTVQLTQPDVRASDPQTVTVTGLASGERVTVTYQGKRISAQGAHATPTGRYRVTFKVDTVWGVKTVKASRRVRRTPRRRNLPGRTPLHRHTTCA